MLKRARAKFLSLPIAVGLAELRGPLEKSYRNTVYCTAELRQESGKITGTYCGNRWCLVCNRIRTARAITRYAPIVNGWKDAHFATLTLTNVPAAELPATMRRMVTQFREITRAMSRTDHVKLVALRKLECTYNARRNDYHPHFHFVVEGQFAARLLVARWMKAFPETTDIRAQDCKKCDAATLAEMFKYFTKLVTKKRGAAPGALPNSSPVPSFALDVIFRAMKGRRVYQPVGFTVAPDAPDDDADEINPQEATDALTRRLERVTWAWSQGAADWVDGDTGEALSGYEPGERFRQFVSAINPPPPPDQ